MMMPPSLLKYHSERVHMRIQPFTLTLSLLTHESYTFEITIIWCASVNALLLYASVKYLFYCMIFHKPCIWMVESSVELFLDAILKVRGGGIISIIYEVKTSPTMEIILTLCASDNALWLCVSSNYLVQYMIFHIIIQLGGFC